jgi:hypothetical protein
VEAPAAVSVTDPPLHIVPLLTVTVGEEVEFNVTVAVVAQLLLSFTVTV